MNLSRYILLFLVCTSSAAFASDAGFTLTATAKDFDSYFPGYFANGYVSTLTGPRGTEGNLSYMVGLMDYAKDDFSRPAAIPGWTEIDYSTGQSAAGHFWMNQVGPNAQLFQDYSQTLDLHEATLTTSYRYIDHGKSTAIKVATFVSQASPHLAATQLTLTPDFDGEVELSFALNLWAPYQPRLPLATLSGDEMQEAVAAHQMKLVAIPPATPDRAPVWYHGDVHVGPHDGDAKALTFWLDGKAEQGPAMAQAAAIELPKGMTATSALVYKSPYRLALNLSVKVKKGKTYTFAKYVAMSREGWGGDAKDDLALASAARAGGFDKLLAAHRAAWANLWKSDIVIDGDEQAQRAVRADLYYLLSSSTANTAWAVGACALTPGYAGHIFWDSDSWVFPALLLLHPERARSLVMFRSRTLAAAQARAREAGLKGAKYPWEADPENGTEQTPHFAHVLGEREIHVNADVAIAQWQYWLATQDRTWLKKDGWPVIRDVADFWASRATWNAQKRRYDILHVTSVDEDYNDVPNDTYTNAAAAKALRIAAQAAAIVGEKADPRWAEVAAKLHVPFDAAKQHHLNFDESVPHDLDTWGGSSLPMLSLPALDLPMSPQVRRNDYDEAIGPILASSRDPNSMGLAPLSIAAATVGDAAHAIAWLEKNFNGGVIKPPFDVRTETATNNTGYFITAAAGFLQNLIFGLTGLRIEESGLNAAYAPLLPPGWRSMTLKNVAFRGKRYDIAVDRGADGKTRLTRTMASAR
ncbi:MAG: glycoside hydrolase family 65 protein [Rudaea sp.]|uniref:glycoside hydrolase family 65 protein n=1 Tax=Rudaea sp. TaxID=2136325 RepID=UPI0039E27678